MLRNYILNMLFVLLCSASCLLCLAIHVFIKRQFELSGGWSALCNLPLAAVAAWFCGYFLPKRWRRLY